MMQAAAGDSSKYAKVIEASKRIRWEIDYHVIRNRDFNYAEHFLPDGLTRASTLGFLNPAEQRLVSQIQGRTYANIFGLVERYIAAKMMEVGRDHALGDQVKLEAVVRFTEEELKHQALFRRLEAMMAARMPAGYRLAADPNAVASAVLSKSTWAVLALTCFIEIFTQVHYRESIEPDAKASALWKDVFLFHWKEESQHAILDELEWRREDAKLTPAQRDAAVDDFIALVGAVDGILQAQAASDSDYFARICGRKVGEADMARVHATFLAAYRWQYILSGASEKRFLDVLTSMIDGSQAGRIMAALATLKA